MVKVLIQPVKWFFMLLLSVDVKLVFYLIFADSTRLGVWILDGDPLHKNLLQYALTVKSINNAVIVQVVDISRPWTIMESLHSWTEVLREHIHSLKLPPKELNEMEERSKPSMLACMHSVLNAFTSQVEFKYFLSE